jgi:CRP-like cAMP-binding protein
MNPILPENGYFEMNFPSACEKNFVAGEMLFLQGDVCQDIGFVAMGEIVIRTTDPEGREFVIQSVKAGQFFGDVMLFANHPKYLGNVTALSLAKVLFFSLETFLCWLKSSDWALKSYLSGLAEKTFELKQNIKLLGMSSLRDKILFYLETEALRQDAKTRLLPMTREAWAAKLNVCRPSLSRELSRMQKDGLIVNAGKKITLLTQ